MAAFGGEEEGEGWGEKLTTFVAVTGCVGPAPAREALRRHGGDLVAAIDGFFGGSDPSSPPAPGLTVRGVGAAAAPFAGRAGLEASEIEDQLLLQAMEESLETSRGPAAPDLEVANTALPEARAASLRAAWDPPDKAMDGALQASARGHATPGAVRAHEPGGAGRGGGDRDLASGSTARAAVEQRQRREPEGEAPTVVDLDGVDGSEGPAGAAPMDTDDIQLPDGINEEEARMLEAAMFGVPYAGKIPDFSNVASVSGEVMEQRRINRNIDDAYAKSLRADREKAEAVQREKEAALALERGRAERKARAERERLEREEARLVKQKSLPAEPEVGGEGVVTVAARLPTGRCSRRFRKSDPLRALYDFVDIQSGLAPNR